MRIQTKHAIRVLGVCLMLALAACAGQREQEALRAQQAAAEAAELAERARQAEVARLEAERSERELRAELERLRLEREEAERARLAAEREAAERARVAAQLQQQQQQAEMARLQREQEAQLAALERRLAEAEANVQRREQANARLSQAITAAEELLQMLASEQLKYENVDAQGNTVEPLQKALISELEERKNALVREAQALSNYVLWQRVVNRAASARSDTSAIGYPFARCCWRA
jgi:hypothetical protein